ncbi:MAG: alpha/beta fold hydrolase [Candidatus Thiodiazotropha sp. (ex Ctena orbiculata)]|nr:alpha/beta fold hydrolase [Candidatus Thiodiazotropha taylori]MBT2995768.1 alpha/beta fold hydrolase [Candidatus Thiodiazotropha taylori]MBT2999083.1 alpha/beta fold hydrolase [Candidatus Thiodiazotropha taylori]MBT3026149.1 alpha/beta fold hydrolase [Candidatus Thiodiazotropha taylori]MBT3035920.1 alpha/beta fold hydrolase [Candidatus Thiodiazotropha taylori]
MRNTGVALHFREFGNPETPKLCLLHGLFGSANNWMSVVKYLQQGFHVIAPDLRNHGRSPHHQEMDYGLMADDLLRLFDSLEISSVCLVGHSMGGKVAMWLALQRHERVEKLVVADIAPVTYAHRFDAIFQALAGLRLDEIGSREEADSGLAEWVSDRGVRQYLLQNLLKQRDGWHWRFNLEGLRSAISDMAGFPQVESEIFAGETLFVHGEKSDYVTDAYRERIAQLFPHYRLRMLHGAGHWLYAEQPQLFAQVVRHFIAG